jgi:hypothetical protein
MMVMMVPCKRFDLYVAMLLMAMLALVLQLQRGVGDAVLA